MEIRLEPTTENTRFRIEIEKNIFWFDSAIKNYDSNDKGIWVELDSYNSSRIVFINKMTFQVDFCVEAEEYTIFKEKIFYKSGQNIFVVDFSGNLVEFYNRAGYFKGDGMTISDRYIIGQYPSGPRSFIAVWMRQPYPQDKFTYRNHNVRKYSFGGLEEFMENGVMKQMKKREFDVFWHDQCGPYENHCNEEPHHFKNRSIDDGKSTLTYFDCKNITQYIIGLPTELLPFVSEFSIDDYSDPRNIAGNEDFCEFYEKNPAPPPTYVMCDKSKYKN